MPKTGDIHTTSGMIHPVDDAVGTNNNLADVGVIELGDDPAHLGKIR